MARIVKHHIDVKEYTEKLCKQYEIVSKLLNGSLAEYEDARAYFKDPSVGLEDQQLLRVIDKTDLEIACDDMIQLMKNIKKKFSTKD